MISTHVFIATSLDGFIARADGDITWLAQHSDPAEDTGYAAFMADKDVILMGRSTFETVCGFDAWPYDRPVMVMSRQAERVNVPAALREQVSVVSQSPAQVLHLLEVQGVRRVYLDGGQLIQSFLCEGLVSDLTVTTVPILLGEGRRLFGPLRQDVCLQWLSTRSLPSGLVQSCYRVLP